MKQYPFSIPPKDYSGRDAAKRQKVGEFNGAVAKVQMFIDRRMKLCTGPDIVTFEALEIARGVNLDVQTVRDVLGQLGESEGLTVMVGDDFEKAQEGMLKRQ